MTDQEYRDELLRRLEDDREQQNEDKKRKKKRKNFLFLIAFLFTALFVTFFCLLKFNILITGKYKQINMSETASGNVNSDKNNNRNSKNAVDKKNTGNIKVSVSQGDAASAGNAAGDGSTDLKDEKKEKNFIIDMSFLGDCCMATDMENTAAGTMRAYEEMEPSTYFFKGVIDEINKDDLTVANCENVFSDEQLPEVEKWGSSTGYNKTDENGKTLSKGFWFKAPAKYASVFSDNSIEAVTIENNHSHDYGEEGHTDTEKALDAAGVKWGTNDKIIYYEKNGFKIAVVCVSFYSEDEGISKLKYLETAKNNSDFQIVFFHGGLEGVHKPDDWKVSVCHSFVDNGADLVIGSHPHVLQKREKYKNVNIVYSMGNFCFGGNTQPENRTIIYKYNLHITEDKVTDSEEQIIPCYVYTGNINNYQPTVIKDENEKKQVLDFMNGDTDSPL